MAVLGIVALWRLMGDSQATLALVLIIAFLVAGLKRPVWLMAALLVSQLTVTSYMVNTPLGSLSLRLLLVLVAIFFAGRVLFKRKAAMGPSARRVLVPIVVLVSISTAANLAFSGFDYAFTDFRNMFVGLAFVVLLPATVGNMKELKLLCGVVFVFVTASAAIGLMQHYGWLGMDAATLQPGFLTAANYLRVPGMGETELELAFILPVAFLAVVGIYLTRAVGADKRGLLLLSSVLMAAALYFTYTRSALLAVLAGLIAMVLFAKTRVSGVLVMTTLFLLLVLVGASNIYLSGRSQAAQEGSSISRPILWQAGMAIVLDNPILGIGGDNFRRVSPEYAGAVDSSLLQWEEKNYFEYRTLGNEPPHNDFLNQWVSYGTFALATYVWLYLVILRIYLSSYRRAKTKFVRGLSLGLAASVAAYAANAFYHNVLTTVPLFWILAGLSLVTSKLTAMEDNPPASRSGRTQMTETPAVRL
jgi:O-antigen ligase